MKNLDSDAGTVDGQLLELVRLMPGVVRALKRQAAASRPAGADALRELLASGSLGPRHLPVIVVLSLDGSTTVSELAHRIGLGVAATSLMVGELAKAGIVERAIDERDRRRTLVSINASLREDCERFAKERLAPLRRALERMGPETRAHFVAGWRTLAEETAGTAHEAAAAGAAAE
ncbi:MAG TPA: MarR family transcriptional regulator [Solirubrobacteraceae bacterium]